MFIYGDGMKVGELVKYLESFDPELMVMAYVPDYNLDEITGVAVKKVLNQNKTSHMFGRYEELSVNHTLYKDGFDALLLIN